MLTKPNHLMPTSMPSPLKWAATHRAASNDSTPSGPLESAPTLQTALLSLHTLGARRLTLIALQLLTELRLAQTSHTALAPLTVDSVQLQRPGTPFEQVQLQRDLSGSFRPQQEREGVVQVAEILAQLLKKCLFLEESIPDARGRFGGVPLTRRVDLPVLRGVHRALCHIAQRCEGATCAPYPNAQAAVDDLTRLSQVVARLVAGRRPAPPVRALTAPKPALVPTVEASLKKCSGGIK